MIKLINVNKYYQSGNDKVHVIRNLNYEFLIQDLSSF